jgi:GDP-L-fucose synthase
MRKQTMLITGHRGLLGSACVRFFTKKYHVRVWDIDLTDESEVRHEMAMLLPDIVINCAAKVGGVKANRDNPVAFMLTNLKIQNNVISAAADFGVKTLVHIGTSCMFPKDAVLPVPESSLLTGVFESSVEAYAIAKLAGWRLCKSYHEERGLNFMTVCPSNIYGIGDSYGNDAHVIPSLIRRLHDSIYRGSEFKVWGNGTSVREFIFSDDVASAIGTVIEKWNSSEVISIGTGIGHTISELVYRMISISGKAVVPVWDTSQPEGIPRKTFDVSSLKSLGWKPSVSLEDGLGRTWEEFTSNPIQRGITPKSQQTPLTQSHPA